MKPLFCVLIILTLLVVGSIQTHAASSANVTITVTVESISISVNPTSWAIGTIAAGSTTQMSTSNKLTVTNDGNVAENFTLQIGSPGGWNASSTPGPDTYVLSGLFTGATDVPEGISFSPEDALSTSPQAASATVFGYPESTGPGAAVPSGASRSLWLQFKAPTSSSLTGQQTLAVTIRASVP